MKDQNEVRIKLHVLNSNDSSVKNIWMSLNYNQRPTIGHIIEHLKTNYREQTTASSDLDDNDRAKLVKLYLDDYWLPPYENSRLIRENDCIKVEIKDQEVSKNGKETDKKSTSKVETAKSTNQSSEAKITDNKANLYYPSFDVTYDVKTSSDSYPVRDYYNYNYANELRNPYVNYASTAINYPNLNDWNSLYSNQKQAAKSSQNSQNSQNLTKSKVTGGSEETTKKSQEQPQSKKDVNNRKKSPTPDRSTNTTSSKINSKQVTNSPNSKKILQTYKKFAIGNYVHMLNEQNDPKREASESDSESDDVSEEQIIDNYYQSIQKSKNDKKPSTQAKPKTENTNPDLDKIANSINTTGKNKWKNSTKPTTQTNGPKHIRFPTSDSSSSSSSSDSSEDEATKTKATGEKKPNTTTTDETKKPTSQYYQPSKEEQLNAVSYNRSFVIRNPKDVSEFKKVFNQTKLNAPNGEEFAAENDKPEVNGGERERERETTGSKSSIKITKNNTPIKKTSPSPPASPKSPRSPKIDFTQFESLTSAPRLNDRIAFQILEISSNFTPEISDYKHGSVIEFDSETNEVTLKLSSKYNAVLKKPSKFSVVLDETEDELNAISRGEKLENNADNDSNEDTIKIDWRNLINVRLIPEGQLLSP